MAIYNYHKLQMIRAKAALSTSKDAEKGSGIDGSGSCGAPVGQIASAASMSHTGSGSGGGDSIVANGQKDSYDSSYRCASQQ